MTRFVLGRVVLAVPQLLLVSALLFALMQSFGDPLATLGARTPPRPEDKVRLRRLLGLDQPIAVQYAVWLVGNDWMQLDMDGDGVTEVRGTRRGVLRGDWGNSLVTRTPVMDVIGERLPNTLLLMLSAQVLIIVVSLLIGLYSALRQYSLFDHLVTAGSFVGYSMPVFMLALLLMYVFGVYFKRWGWPALPTVGMFDPMVGRTPAQVALHMVMPVTTLAVISIAGYSRYIRASVLEVMAEDFVRTARAKGVGEARIVWRHILKNAALPFVTLVGLDLPFLLGGAVVTETVFGWPGMGRLFIDHTRRADFPVLMGILMLTAVAVVIFQILTDIAYSVLDPRIRVA